jgi:hypothetical protein
MSTYLVPEEHGVSRHNLLMEEKRGLRAYTPSASTAFGFADQHTEDVALRFTTALTKEHALFANYEFMVILAVLFRVI